MLPTIVTDDRIDLIKEMILKVADIEGDYWECGVYKGGTASHIHSVMPSSKQLVLFDSFEGLPEPTIHDNVHKQGDFNDVDFLSIKSYFEPHNNVQLVKGWVPDTFKNFTDSKLCFVHIDLDLYEGYKYTLEFVWPRLSVGGVVIFDDYHASTCQGSKIAVDEFVAEHGLNLLSRGPSYWVFKN